MKNRKKKYRVRAGKLGGKARTKRKRLAAIRNGAKGGRPRKVPLAVPEKTRVKA